MAPEFRLEVSIGDHRFSATGEVETVNEAFGKWLAALPPSTPEHPWRPIAVAGPVAEAESEQFRLLDDRVTFGEIPPWVLNNIYATDAGELRLVMGNQTAGNVAASLLLLLYGLAVKMQRYDVLGSELLGAATASGLGLERVDREVERLADSVVSQGTRRGKRYALTQRGVDRAEQILLRWAKYASPKQEKEKGAER